MIHHETSHTIHWEGGVGKRGGALQPRPLTRFPGDITNVIHPRDYPPRLLSRTTLHQYYTFVLAGFCPSKTFDFTLVRATQRSPSIPLERARDRKQYVFISFRLRSRPAGCSMGCSDQPARCAAAQICDARRLRFYRDN
jgi:hypothetical protein